MIVRLDWCQFIRKRYKVATYIFIKPVFCSLSTNYIYSIICTQNRSTCWLETSNMDICWKINDFMKRAKLLSNDHKTLFYLKNILTENLYFFQLNTYFTNTIIWNLSCLKLFKIVAIIIDHFLFFYLMFMPLSNGHHSRTMKKITLLCDLLARFGSFYAFFHFIISVYRYIFYSFCLLE